MASNDAALRGSRKLLLLLALAFLSAAEDDPRDVTSKSKECPARAKARRQLEGSVVRRLIVSFVACVSIATAAPPLIACASERNAPAEETGRGVPLVVTQHLSRVYVLIENDGDYEKALALGIPEPQLGVKVCEVPEVILEELKFTDLRFEQDRGVVELTPATGEAPSPRVSSAMVLASPKEYSSFGNQYTSDIGTLTM